MVTVDQYGCIRLAHRDGMSIRELARRFSLSCAVRKKISDFRRPAGVKIAVFT